MEDRHFDGAWADPGGAHFVETPSSFILGMGVTASEHVDDTHVGPHTQEEAALAVQDEEDEEPAAPPREAAPVQTPLHGEVRKHLKGFFTEISSGTVKHRFTPSAILRSLVFQKHLRPGGSLADALAAGSHSLLDDRTADSVSRDLSDGRCALPSVSLLRVSRLRLDIISVLYSQNLF